MRLTADSKRRSRETSDAGESGSAQLRILIVEDDPEQRRALRHFLELSGYPVVSASDYDSAIRAAGRQTPDLAICDWKIDGHRTGVDVARALHARYRLDIIFMTGASVDELRRDSSDLPVVRYFRKPVMPDALARTVQALR